MADSMEKHNLVFLSPLFFQDHFYIPAEFYKMALYPNFLNICPQKALGSKIVIITSYFGLARIFDYAII